MSEEKHKSLKVQKGIEQPSSINRNFKFKKQNADKIDVDKLFKGIREGKTDTLSKAITLVESTKESHIEKAQKLIEKCLPYSGKSIRIGITGVPGVGKSTFIDSFGSYVCEQGNKLAVLAIDPSSSTNKGSILGDKTRMESLVKHENAFIRPTASSGSLGGVARMTKESIILCEAAGFDTIFIETVGVGQSETHVHGMVDFFLLLMLAGAGDELQGIKRGIMEMCDAMVINKADGDNIDKAKQAKREYENALHIFPPKESDWTAKVHTCSALNKTGIDTVWQSILDYKSYTLKNGYFYSNRRNQELNRFEQYLKESLSWHFHKSEHIKEKIKDIKVKILDGKRSIYGAVKELLEEYFKEISK